MKIRNEEVVGCYVLGHHCDCTTTGIVLLLFFCVQLIVHENTQRSI